MYFFVPSLNTLTFIQFIQGINEQKKKQQNDTVLDNQNFNFKSHSTLKTLTEYTKLVACILTNKNSISFLHNTQNYYYYL